jgi:hypothetical protein
MILYLLILRNTCIVLIPAQKSAGRIEFRLTGKETSETLASGDWSVLDGAFHLRLCQLARFKTGFERQC